MSKTDKMADFLLANANPSIRYRVRAEFLGEDVPESEIKAYHKKILKEKILKTICASQLIEGWIGLGLHGPSDFDGQYDNQETATKYMGEKGLKGSAVLNDAMQAYARQRWTDLCCFNKGKYYSEFSTPAYGANILRSACIARAGYASSIDITPQIGISLESFKRVLEVSSVLDVSHLIKNGKKRVFNDDERWPCRYHLDILAHTDSWKSEESVKMLASSVEKMMICEDTELMSLIPYCWVGRPVSSAGAFPSQGLAVKASDFYLSPIKCDDGNPEYYNIEYLEWFARCGIIKHIPALMNIVDEISESVDENGICRLPVSDKQFNDWGTHCGLRLETDWKSPLRRDCDVTFRALLIMHYANKA